MHVLSLAGPKGSGKNTLATFIREALDWCGVIDHDEVAFADPMRWACDAIGIPADVTRERKTEVSGHVNGATGREVLVALGECMRSLAPDFWADHMGHRLNAIAHGEPDAIVIVTDTRRDNEVAVLEAWASVDAGRHLAKLWIERPGHEADEVLESTVRARCIVLSNAGSLADLRAKAEGIADWLAGETAQVAL